MSLLKVVDLYRNFGGLAALSGVNVDIDQGELIGLIGPNGAGKTTLFNVITGIYEPSSGSVELLVNDNMVDISHKKTDAINRLGIARTFQNIRLFKDMSVIDNVKVAMNSKIKYGLLHTFLRTDKYYQIEDDVDVKAKRLLSVVNLNDKACDLAKNLPYGDQRKLEIARALASSPTLLFLDEPAAGMNPQETAELTSLIKKIKNDLNLTIVLIEHDMSLVMNLCERIYVLDYGRCIANGFPDQIKKDKRVIKAYLGKEN